MLAKRNTLLVLVVTLLLGGGLLVSYHLLAEDSHKGCGEEGKEHEKCGGCKEGQEGECKEHKEHKGETNADEPTPADLVKEADALIKELGKAKDDNAKAECYKKMMEHTAKLAAVASRLLAECDEMLKSEHPDTEKMTENTKQAIMLLKKSVELTQKCHEWLAKQPKKASPGKAEVVPHKITEAEVGKEVKCPVMGSVFKVRKNTTAAEYKGKVYYFCRGGCLEEFKKNPEKYADK